MKLTLLLLCSIFLFLGSCSESSTKSESNSLEQEKVEESKDEVIILPRNYYKRFKGKIGDYPVTMEFIKMDSIISGSYYYDNVKSPLSIHGIHYTDSTINFNERSFENGKNTGRFSGRIINGAFVGTWTNAKTKKELEFKLRSQPSKIVRFVGTNRMEEKCHVNYEDNHPSSLSNVGDTLCSNIILQSLIFECENPLLETKIQKAIEEETSHLFGGASTYSEVFAQLKETDHDDGFSAEIDCSIKSIYKNYISIEISCYMYSFYTAHPNMYITIINFDLNTGKRIEWDNLIKDNSIEALKSKIRPLFEKKHGGPEDGWNYEDGDFLLARNFSIEPNGIRFCYNPYEIGSYAQGMPSILVPYEKIKNLIQPIGN